MEMDNTTAEPLVSPMSRLRNRILAFSYQQMHTSNKEETGDDSLKKTAAKQENNSNCRFKILTIVAFCIIVTLIVLIVWQHFHYKSNLDCMTSDCVTTSARILTKMNASVDPCENFYEYACGGWEKNTFIPPEKGKYGAFSEVTKKNAATIKKLFEKKGSSYKERNSTAIEKVKMYYKTCMNQSEVEKLGITPLLQVIKDLGSWTVTSSNVSGIWNETSWDFVAATMRIHLINQAALFSMKIAPDDKNNSQNILVFQQSGLTLAVYNEYLTNDSKKFQDAFMGFGTKFGKLLGGTESVVASRMAEIYQLEKQLAEIYEPKDVLQDPAKFYNKMTVAQFQELIGGKEIFDLKRYLDGMFHDDVPLTEEVLVFTVNYFKKLGAVIKNTSKEVLNNYFVWAFVQYTAGYLPDTFVDATLILSKAESGITEVAPRWQRCVVKSSGTLAFATGALFVEDQFSQESKNTVGNILEQVRRAFLSNLKYVSWMDASTKKKAIEKAEAVTKLIGYPDYIMDPVKLDEHYENLTILDGLFMQNYVTGKKWGRRRLLDKRGKPPDCTEWSMAPSAVNAYYSPAWNHVVVPAGILQPPFFDPIAPIFLNIGSLGFILGHELTHGFDKTGRNYDKYGNLKNWWSNSSAESFSKKETCMENQYSGYSIDGIKLDGEHTLGENTADNGGLKAAYSAYTMNSHAQAESPLPGLGLSNDQLFFLSFAQVWCSYYRPAYVRQAVFVDVHSIAKFRVIGVVSNSAEFSSAYQCPLGSPMNPKKKCRIW